MNDSGQIVGASPTSVLLGPFGIPSVNPFRTNGKMQDLGSLGGNFGGANASNARGQVVGASSLAEIPIACFFYFFPGCHAFLWDNGSLTDLGTLGGSFSAAEVLNDVGDVAGFAATADDTAFHAFAWKNGVMFDMGTVGEGNFSRASGMNEKGQAVGQSWLFDGEKHHGLACLPVGRGQPHDGSEYAGLQPF